MKDINCLKGGLIAMAAFFIPALLSAQADWQQRTDYTIKVRLDDVRHRLHGEIRIEYHNNSPQALQEMYIHLWPNAYSGTRTALAKQELEHSGNTHLFRRDGGFIDSLSFTVDGTAVSYTEWEKNPDVVYIRLPQSLPSGGKISLHTPFRVDLPDGEISRLGHLKQAYMITQWYPKPAVYDQNGWHPMPYLSQGEFYSDFGSFDVEITLPANYVVGATGELQTQSEIRFLQKKLAEAAPDPDLYQTPASAAETKTLHYTQDRVHDFAWFADKDFVVRADTAVLQSGRNVYCYALATVQNAGSWRRAASWVKKGVEYYSKRIAEYPYSYCTAVDGTIAAGGGMEYPMITIIGDGDEERTIIHEVGHNWFYGILASDERSYPWLDEGLNTYYEDACFRDMSAYSRKRIPAINLGGDLMEAAGSEFVIRHNGQQSPGLPAVDYSALNYGLEVYTHTGNNFHYLEMYLGRALFDSCMQAYYKTWAFRHPGPMDIRNVFEEVSGKDLGWFFEGLMKERILPDLSLRIEGTNTLVLKNTYTHPLPVEISFIKGKVRTRSMWLEPFSGEQTLQADLSGCDWIEVNYRGVLREKDRSNNYVKPSGAGRNGIPAGVLPYISLPVYDKMYMGLGPVYAWNNYNKSMIGLLLHNKPLVPRRQEFLVLPLISFNPIGFAALGDYRYRLLPDRSRLAFMDIGVNFRRFAWDFTEKALNYNRIEVRAEGEFKRNKPAVPKRSGMQLRYMFINKQTGGMYAHLGIRDINYEVGELSYWYEHYNRRFPFYVKTALEYKHDFYRLNGRKPTTLKLWAEATQKINYVRNRKGLEIRAFAGVFLLHANTLVNNNLQMNGWSGPNDYLLDHFYFGRSDTRGFTGNQFVEREGNFKVYAPGGQSGRFLTSLNLKADFPVQWVPIGVYADFGLHAAKVTDVGTGTVSNQWNGFYNAGLYVNVIPGGACSIYFPIPQATSKNLMFANNDFKNPYWSYVRFSLNLMKLNPFKFREWVRELK